MNRPTLGKLLVVDDEVAQMRALCDTLAMEGYGVRGFDSPQAALNALQPGEYDLLLTDLQMPEMDGIALIAATRAIDPAVGAIVMTGHGTIDTAVQAMQGGALDYILKPFRLNVILTVIARALDLQRLRRENAALQERERRRSEELAAAYQDLESFSYSVSHDLRGPLVFVKGFADVLDEEFGEALGDKGRHMVQIIRDGSRNMDAMIVGLLAFSRATRQPLRLTQLDMGPIVRASLADALAAYEGPDPDIEVATLPRAAADSTVIRHVWLNLIGNALKYSATREQPKIRISGHVAGAEAVFKVEDNGVGFDMRYAEKLFGVFRRLHGANEFAGTGVGLAIVHRIVTRHGGRVWADSSPGEGARFHFTLPAEAAD
jgi:two-component system, sensor histidine kinase and response regulator